jgi:hypothetical protein
MSLNVVEFLISCFSIATLLFSVVVVVVVDMFSYHIVWEGRGKTLYNFFLQNMNFCASQIIKGKRIKWYWGWSWIDVCVWIWSSIFVEWLYEFNEVNDRILLLNVDVKNCWIAKNYICILMLANSLIWRRYVKKLHNWIVFCVSMLCTIYYFMLCIFQSIFDFDIIKYYL